MPTNAVILNGYPINFNPIAAPGSVRSMEDMIKSESFTFLNWNSRMKNMISWQMKKNILKKKLLH